MLHITIECVHRRKQETGQPCVCGHERTMRQQIRIENQQRQRDEPGRQPEHFTRRKKNQHSQQNGQK